MALRGGLSQEKVTIIAWQTGNGASFRLARVTLAIGDYRVDYQRLQYALVLDRESVISDSRRVTNFYKSGESSWEDVIL